MPRASKSRKIAAGSCAALLISSSASFSLAPSLLPSSPRAPPPPSFAQDCSSRFHGARAGYSALRLDISPGEEDGNGGDAGANEGRGRFERKHPARTRRTARRREEAANRRRIRERGRAPPSLDGLDRPDDEPTASAAAEEEPAPTAPDPQLEDAIDSFLRGEYDRPFSEDAPAPHPGLGPGQAVDAALRSLRDLDDPEPSHGAAVFLRFCAPLSRGDRWGGGGADAAADPWKEVLRGAIAPTMLARRVRASPFAGLLDWERLDVTEGLSIPTTREQLGVGTTVAFVNAAMFWDGVEPSMVQFTLRKIGGVWLIDSAVISKKEWFIGDRSSL